MSEVTHILNAIADGDGLAAEHLLPLVYDELRKLAALRFSFTPIGVISHSPGLVLQPWEPKLKKSLPRRGCTKDRMESNLLSHRWFNPFGVGRAQGGISQGLEYQPWAVGCNPYRGKEVVFLADLIRFPRTVISSNCSPQRHRGHREISKCILISVFSVPLWFQLLV